LLESGIHSLYHEGWLKVGGLPIPLDTTAIDAALLGKLSRNGFAWGQKCTLGLEAIDLEPTIKIRKEDGLSFKA